MLVLRQLCSSTSNASELLRKSTACFLFLHLTLSEDTQWTQVQHSREKETQRENPSALGEGKRRKKRRKGRKGRKKDSKKDLKKDLFCISKIEAGPVGLLGLACPTLDPSRSRRSYRSCQSCRALHMGKGASAAEVQGARVPEIANHSRLYKLTSLSQIDSYLRFHTWALQTERKSHPESNGC